MNFFEELKRRNVFRVGIAYGVAAWLLIQVTDIVFPRIGLPDSAVTLVIALLAIGFIPALIFAWAFEMTPEGIKREADVDRAESNTPKTGKKLDRAIIAVLALAVGFLLYKQTVDGPPSQTESPTAGQAATMTAEGSSDTLPGRKSVAVLPFVAMSSGEDDGYFADGLTEEILNSLAGLPELMVTARTSSFHFKGQDLPVQDIAAKLGVDNIVEGSVRRNGDQIRITAQLVRATDGFHLWSDTYDGTIGAGFDMQTRIAEKVAQSLDVVLNEQKRERMRITGLSNPEAFIAFQKGQKLFNDAHDTSNNNQHALLREANVHFERVMELVPRFTYAYTRHSDLYAHILLDAAKGELDPGLEGIDLESTRRAAKADFNAAVEQALDDAQRADAELDRAIFSGNWRGLSRLLDRALSSGECTGANWEHIVSAPFGKASLLQQESLRQIRCDPMRADGYGSLIFSAIWEKDFRKALEFSASAVKNTSRARVGSMHIMALVANDALNEAEKTLEETVRSESGLSQQMLLIAAARGDKARIDSLEQDISRTQSPSDQGRILRAARRGDRQAANDAAARIDARPFGYVVLAQTVYTCLCGAPFDLEATPNFAARLEEAGMPWPPPDTIDFPLKDW